MFSKILSWGESANELEYEKKEGVKEKKMIFDNKLKQFIYSQVRDSLLEMHMDDLVYVSNATEGDLIIMRACLTLENNFSNDRIPTTQDVNQAITKAYLELYPQSEGTSEDRFDLKPEDFAELKAV